LKAVNRTKLLAKAMGMLDTSPMTSARGKTNKAQRKAYEDLFLEVREILNRHDPMDLISLGAPESEYEPEVGTILPRLKEAKGPRKVRSIVRGEFKHWFGEAPSNLKAIADDVWAALERFRNSVSLD
jgi:predicted aconitase